MSDSIRLPILASSEKRLEEPILPLVVASRLEATPLYHGGLRELGYRRLVKRRNRPRVNRGISCRVPDLSTRVGLLSQSREENGDRRIGS